MDVKRYLLPPLVALPVVVGFLFILNGALEGGGTVAIALGLSILIGNAVFWPLLFEKRAKRSGPSGPSAKR